MAQESPQGGRMTSASSLQAHGCAFSEPRSQVATSWSFIARPTRHGRIFRPRFSARSKSLYSDLIRGWGGGRQTGEMINQCGDS